jgi:hypothetical protein
VAERFTRRQRIYLDSRTAVFAVSAQVVKTLEAAALALPVADLILDKIECCRAAEIRDGKDGLKDGLETSVLTLFRQEIHLQETVIGFPLNLD